MSNRFGKPRATAPSKEEVKNRFSQEVQEEQAHIVYEKTPRKTRTDYKGERKQVGFRLPVEIVNDLAFLHFATDETQGSICEEALRKELKRRKERLREKDEQEYNQLIKIFKRKR